MEDRETSRMCKYEESKTTQITITTVRHVTSDSGLRKFQADGFLLTWVYITCSSVEDAQNLQICTSYNFLIKRPSPKHAPSHIIP